MKSIVISISIAIGVLVLVIMVANCGTEHVRPDLPSSDGFDAYLMSQKFIKDRLLAPRTAQFCSFNETKVTVEGLLFEVSGCVDAQNVYGALVRQHYRCTLQYVGHDRWQLIGLPNISTN
jgi:hypothetical protein